MSSTQFDGDIDSFVSYLKSNRGLSANTLKAYRADLTACLHLFELRGVTDLNEITLDDLRSWMAVESRDHARSSMARKTVAVRGFFAWAYEHGVTNTDPPPHCDSLDSQHAARGAHRISSRAIIGCRRTGRCNKPVQGRWGSGSRVRQWQRQGSRQDS